jgi:hypothetical protein
MEFKCLDDLKDKIDPKYYENVNKFMPFFEMIYGPNSTYKDVMRSLEPHESNLHCLKSIKYNPKKKSNAQAIFGGKYSTINVKKKPQHFFRSTGRDKGKNFLT